MILWIIAYKINVWSNCFRFADVKHVLCTRVRLHITHELLELINSINFSVTCEAGTHLTCSRVRVNIGDKYFAKLESKRQRVRDGGNRLVSRAFDLYKRFACVFATLFRRKLIFRRLGLDEQYWSRRYFRIGTHMCTICRRRRVWSRRDICIRPRCVADWWPRTGTHSRSPLSPESRKRCPTRNGYRDRRPCRTRAGGPANTTSLLRRSSGCCSKHVHLVRKTQLEQ